jgi:lysyl-tRNA synthetase class 2
MSCDVWQASASWKALQQRAETLNVIRSFFTQKDVLEVDTPALMQAASTDLHLDSIRASVEVSGIEQTLYLQTSPEFALKRLLATYGKSVFQIAKAFRNGEAGRRHNPEFTLLEWYRPGYSFEQLMAEVAELVGDLLRLRSVEYHSYRALFLNHLDVDPFDASEALLVELCLHQTGCNMEGEPISSCLDLLMSHCIEPTLGQGKMTFVYDFPASQAALSKLSKVDGVYVAKRFELYVAGSELANGYDELLDAKEQQQRFMDDTALRRKFDKPIVPWDKKLVAALESNMEACCGVALGIDRLLMLRFGYDDIRDVIAFPFDRI